MFPIDERVTVHTLRSRWGSVSPVLTHLTGRPLLSAGELSKFLRQGFDVTHWHNLSLVGGPGALALAEGVRLCTLHDYWWMCPTSILFKNNREACEEKACIRCTLAHRRPPQLWRYGSLLGEAARNIDCFLAPSDFVRQKYDQAGIGISATVLPHFSPGFGQPVAATPGDYYLFVGRLEKAKGLQSVIPFFGETGRRLIIAGAGTYESKLRQLAAPYPKIEFLGRVEHWKLGGLYGGARATILPSLCYETFGLTVLESLTQGTPAIVSRTGAPQELIAHTGGGACYGDLREFKAIIDAWDADPHLPAALGREGSLHLEKYRANLHLTTYLSLIESYRTGEQRATEKELTPSPAWKCRRASAQVSAPVSAATTQSPHT
jgi:glycosyltransferase involved in cell wall biosynthesis